MLWLLSTESNDFWNIGRIQLAKKHKQKIIESAIRPIYYKCNVRWNVFKEWRKPESPKQLFSWRARWCYVYRHQKLLKDTSFIILSIYCEPVKTPWLYKYQVLFFTLKSIVPLLSASNVLKTFSQNLSASPAGKNILYISQKVFGVSFPLGQSCDCFYKQWQPQRQRPKRQNSFPLLGTILRHC